MDRGYVKLWRKSLDNDWLTNYKLWAFWCWCLLKATYRPHKAIVGLTHIDLDPGQFIFGRKKCSKETRLSDKTVRSCLHSLKTAGNLAIKSTNKYSIISIINWELYQGDDCEIGQQKGQQKGQQRASKGPAKGHIQEGKEGKEGKEEKIESGGVGVVPDWIPIQIWKDWKEFRIRKKAPLTDRAAKKTIDELGRLRGAGNDPEAVLEQSIYRGWTGVFALKSEFKKESPQTRAEKVRASMEIMARREYERQAQENREEKGHRPCSDTDVCLLPDRSL